MLLLDMLKFVVEELSILVTIATEDWVDILAERNWWTEAIDLVVIGIAL